MRFLSRNRDRICANSVALLIGFGATTAAAMTVEDCQRLGSTLGNFTVSGGDEVRVSSSLTEDGWCRMLEGPLGRGVEWRSSGNLTDGTFQFRQKRHQVEDLGEFDLTGRLSISGGTEVALGPVRLTASDGDGAALTARLAGPNTITLTNLQSLEMESAGFGVEGQNGLVGDILAWAFRLDRAAAASSFIEARDQRAEMLDWLAETAEPIIDRASANAFRKMVEAYPRARGTAEITIREDRSVAIGPLVSAVLFGTSLTRAEAAGLVGEAGLRFTWTPR